MRALAGNKRALLGLAIAVAIVGIVGWVLVAKFVILPFTAKMTAPTATPTPTFTPTATRPVEAAELRRRAAAATAEADPLGPLVFATDTTEPTPTATPTANPAATTTRIGAPWWLVLILLGLLVLLGAGFYRSQCRPQQTPIVVRGWNATGAGQQPQPSGRHARRRTR